MVVGGRTARVTRIGPRREGREGREGERKEEEGGGGGERQEGGGGREDRAPSEREVSSCSFAQQILDASSRRCRALRTARLAEPSPSLFTLYQEQRSGADVLDDQTASLGSSLALAPPVRDGGQLGIGLGSRLG